ncbi:murein biosynthesis integral membrane protein MurJ [Glaciihabitans arcticus]|uniref:Murein biosynthesis integral membrane protein MurJ n=1 Tax=Glaciihabitans arcticus TaxID=2668039 RepID=A0A4Q9GV80_9MICO|nr:murein biosynthesis integral membrane protein MurJ [Glaciihabitans arcticus]TBN58134.1 murein biosynthesis integral membrane protein MurJ [Glaciihabitans arcticus]
MSGQSIGRSSAILASGTLISRILGLVSALVLAAALGQLGVGDAFALANQLPNNIYAIIAGGLLSAILVPQIVRAEKHPDGGQLYINRLITLGLVVFLLIAVLATVAAPLLVDFYSQQGGEGSRGLDPADRELANLFAYWCLPQIFFYAVYSLLGEVLNARRVFGPFTWAPVVNNVIAIGGLVAFIVMFGADPANAEGEDWTTGMIALVAGSATLGVVVQAAFLMLFWRRSGLSYRPDFRWRGVGLGTAGKAAAWTFAMITVTQLAGVVQNRVASLASGEGASINTLRFSWLIFMLPHSIAAVSIATPYFTRMSGSARDGDFAAVRRDLSSSLRGIGVILVFAAVGLVVLAYPFSALFSVSGGTVDFATVSQMAPVVIFYLLGLIPFSVLFVLQRTFYALEDTRTPFFFTVLQSSLFVLGALVVATWPTSVIAIGIAAVTSIAGTVQFLTAALILRRRLGGIDAKRVLRQYALYLLASLPAAAVGVGLLFVMGGTVAGGFAVSSLLNALLSMAAIGTAMAGVYFGVLWLLRVAELRAFVGPLLARIRRRS